MFKRLVNVQSCEKSAPGFLAACRTTFTSNKTIVFCTTLSVSAENVNFGPVLFAVWLQFMEVCSP